MGHLYLHNIAEQDVVSEASRAGSEMSPSFPVCVTLGRQGPYDLRLSFSVCKMEQITPTLRG